MGAQSGSGAVSWHDDIAEDFDQGYARSAAFGERATLWQALIAAHVATGDDVLDAGCGAGIFSFMAAERGAQVTAIDGSGNMIAICKREQTRRGADSIDFSEAMLSALDNWPAASFDTILSSSVLEYVPGYEAVLANLVRLMRPGGRLIVSMPNARALYRKMETVAFALTGKPRYYAHVVNLADPDTLGGQLDGLGLELVERHFFADPPVLGGLASLLSPERRKTLFVQVARKPL